MKKNSNLAKKGKKLIQNAKSDDPAERFNLIILKSERIRMVKLQTKCLRDRRVCNLSEILRIGISAIEKLPNSEIQAIVKDLEDL